jgi:hypothetical protein
MPELEQEAHMLGFVAKAKNMVIWRSQVDAYLRHLAMSSGFATKPIC